jgi:Transcriptional regulator, AbiEi antitoxin, Type IV TA system
VKMLDLPKEKDLEAQFEPLLRSLFEKIPFLKLKSVQQATKAGNSERAIDWLVSASVGDRRWIFAVEAKRSAQPREVRLATLVLRSFLAQAPGKVPYYGIVLAPFISEESAQICKEAGLGYADLAGNAWISFDQVFIETRSAENPFREKHEIKSLFTPRSSRVLRVLLQGPLRPWKTIELAESSKVSLGWVSEVGQELLAQEWAVRDSSGLRISKPDAVLDAWAKADSWEDRTTLRQYSSLLADPTEIATALRDFLGKREHAFTQWFAGSVRHPYTLPPVVTAYVSDFPEESELEKKLLARRVEQGGRLWLVRANDQGVFYPKQNAEGFELASDVQIYLDLLSAGQRGDEQAAELRKWPDFSGGWGR